MIWDELQVYIARKELSPKAVKEIVEKLESGQYSSDEEAESLVRVLLKLKTDVAYNFLTGKSSVITNELVKKIADNIRVDNPNKAGHIYVIVVAMAHAEYLNCANILLLKFVKSNVVGKLNKQLYDGFRKVIKYGAESFLFSKMEGWEARNLNLYTRLLSESMEYLNETDFTVCVKKFIDNNEINTKIPETKGNETVLDANDTKPKKIQKNDDSFKNLDLHELIKFFEQKVLAVIEENKLKSKEIEELKSENVGLKTSNADLNSEKEKLIGQLNDSTQKIFELEKQVRDLNNNLDDANSLIEKYKCKLNNVESAYGQAGQTEIDALKGNIRKRLGSEYEKYMEIKDKVPDLGYYEILLAVLEDVFRALKKNGITF